MPLYKIEIIASSLREVEEIADLLKPYDEIVVREMRGSGNPSDDPHLYDVVLTAGGDTKIQLIKEIRSITALGLKEAKDVADNVDNGYQQVIAQNVTAEFAEKAVRQLGYGGGVAHLERTSVTEEEISTAISRLGETHEQLTNW